jgi:hypothetical protein
MLKRLNWFSPCVALALVAAGGWLATSHTSTAQQPPAPKPVVTPKQAATVQPGTVPRSTFMRLKLQPVKDVLEAIALEDFDRISAAAERIHLLSLDESWMVMQTDEYQRQSDEFRRAVKVMVDAARDRNIDGATLGYMQMTMNCVRCHRQLRNPE